MEEEIEEIRRKKMEELKKAQEAQNAEIQKQLVLRQILTNEARNRLVRIKMARPEFAEQIELQLIQLAQSGKLEKKITDEDLKTILRSLQQKKPNYRIMRR